MLHQPPQRRCDPFSLEQRRSSLSSAGVAAKSPPLKRAVDLDVDIGADAVDYNAIAKAESLSGLEVEMRKLEGVVKEIVDELNYLKRREARMRDTNGALVIMACPAARLTHHDYRHVHRVDKRPRSKILDPHHRRSHQLGSLADLVPSSVRSLHSSHRRDRADDGGRFFKRKNLIE